MKKDIFQIVESIKKEGEYSSDGEVAAAFDMTKTALSNHKARRTIPYEALSTFCDRSGFSLDWLLTGTGAVRRGGYDQGPVHSIVSENRADFGDYEFVSQVRGEISAGGGLIPDNAVELKIAFRKEWIKRRGDPNNMSLIRVSGDSMEPTLLSGDLALVDHGRNYVDPQGGIYAIALDQTIMIKRIQVMHPSMRLKVISDNNRYESIETNPDQLRINGKVIWFGREIER
ncbi:MAG: helix-turn-helix domain-containing protein [Nitrospirae bacterium]|nr:helix-turn-helix domain-containing protein [Nitrospirota bacterium]